MQQAMLKSQADPMLNFSKYDFVKSYIKHAKTDREKLLKEEEGCLIADAIKENNNEAIKNLATKSDLEREITRIDNKIDISSRDTVIKMTAIMATLLALFQVFERIIG